MTAISRLRVQNIRTHHAYDLSLSSSVTAITGSNGSGKTSLLEAIYIALRGSSFRGSDKDVLRKDSEWWRIDLVMTDETSRTVKFEPSKTSSKKQFVINNKTSYRLSSKDKIPVVLFEPDDLRLLHGSPARRRLFIDRFISQIDPSYEIALRKYDRALKQRNTLLKQTHISADDLFAWNVSLSEYGAYIIESRINFTETINQRLGLEYAQIANTDDVVSVHYSHTLISNAKAKLLSELHAHTEKDKILGFTSVGPHRHDIIFLLNNAPAPAMASRGELRTIVLALKFIESAIIEHITGKKPVMLLDDVFSELDTSRQVALSKLMGQQIIITSTSGSGYGDEYVHTLPART